jgi:hypothetical protein
MPLDCADAEAIVAAVLRLLCRSRAQLLVNCPSIEKERHVVLEPQKVVAPRTAYCGTQGGLEKDRKIVEAFFSFATSTIRLSAIFHFYVIEAVVISNTGCWITKCAAAAY